MDSIIVVFVFCLFILFFVFDSTNTKQREKKKPRKHPTENTADDSKAEEVLRKKKLQEANEILLQNKKWKSGNEGTHQEEPLTYESLLQDSRWKDKRLQILERDDFKCCWCGYKRNLQVHHKYYNKYPNGTKVEPWDYPNTALITLCDRCHKIAHEKYGVKIYFRRYKIKGFQI